MPVVRLRLPHWTAHPAFGVVVLLVLAVALIAHGEPQPSSRPSGRSVIVGSSTPTNVALPSTLLIRAGAVERRQGSQIRHVALPAGVQPRSVLTSHGFSILLAVRSGRQYAYGITGALTVIDLGLADGVLPSSFSDAAFVIERAVIEPGRVADNPANSAGTSSKDSLAGTTSRSASATPTLTAPQPRDYVARRYDAKGHLIAEPIDLPPGARIAADTAVGLVVWKPVGIVVDRGQVVESLSASAALIRPDLSVRLIGPVHPLASTARDLLVWDVARGEFGIMALTSVTARSTLTTTPSATASGSAQKSRDQVSSAANPADVTSAADGSPAAGSTGAGSAADGSPAAGSTEAAAGPTDSDLSSTPTALASPSTVTGTRWFSPTRGFVVTGPASFSPDGTAFAAYGQVGDRRRLVVSQVSAVGTNQIEVLALTQPTQAPSAASSDAAATSVVPVSGTLTTSNTASFGSVLPKTSPGPRSSGASSSGLAPSGASSPLPSSTEPAFEPEGFPVLAPATPVWLRKLVVAVASDGTVIGYTPGSGAASVLDFGARNVVSLAAAP